MAEPIILNDAQLDETLESSKPALILFSNGEGLRNEFVMAFKKAMDDNPQITFARINPQANPAAAARFQIDSKPVLIGWFNGEEVLRRPKPWGSDVPLAVEMLQNAAKSAAPAQTEPDVEEKPVEKQAVVVDDRPVIVTDETFEQEVLNYDKPVLVDFWAEWCGPCRMVAPVLEKLAKEFAGQVRIAKVNVDENPGLSQAFRIMSIPTIMMIKQRTMVFNQPGALPETALRDLIRKLIALEIPPQPAQETPVQ